MRTTRQALFLFCTGVVVMVVLGFLSLLWIDHYRLGIDLPRTNELFVDSTGMEWRVLTRDANKNKLIIAERGQFLGNRYAMTLTLADGTSRIVTVPVGVQFNSENVFTSLSESDVLRPTLDAWFANILAPELRERALPAENIDNVASDMEHELQRIDPRLLTHVGAGSVTPQNAMFVLSITEVRKYAESGTFNILYRSWLRSPGVSEGRVAQSGASDPDRGRRRLNFCEADATRESGFRPAMWIRSP